MADWNGLSTSDTVSGTFTKIRNLLIDAGSLMKGTIINPVLGLIAFNRTDSAFEEYDGTSWVRKPVGLLGGGTGATTAAAARTNLGLGTVAEKNKIITADITDGAVTVAKTSGFGSLATKNTVATADIDNASVTAAKAGSGWGSLAFLNNVGSNNVSGQLSVAVGGTGSSSASGARTNLGAAASGANNDINSLSAYTSNSTYTITKCVSEGANAVTSYSANHAIHAVIGRWRFFQTHITLNLSAARTELITNLPASIVTSKWQSGSGTAFIPGTGFRNISWRTSGTTSDVVVTRDDNAQFPAVSDIEISIGGTFLSN